MLWTWYTVAYNHYVNINLKLMTPFILIIILITQWPKRKKTRTHKPLSAPTSTMRASERANLRSKLQFKPDRGGCAESEGSAVPCAAKTRRQTSSAKRGARANMSDEFTVLFSRKLVKQFILKYKELVCLWHKHAPNYKSKKDRIDAITQLTRLVQSYDPAATRVHVLRKIDSLRACVRREYRRVTDSRKVARNESEVYVPQLWYYSLFSFVLDIEEVKEVESPSSSPEPQAVVSK